MRNIDLSNISSTVGMPSKSGLLQHLQAAYQEAFAALVGFNVGEDISTGSRIFYAFVDCLYSITGSVYTISAGAISNNGKIYLVDSQSVTVAGGQVVVGTVTKSYLTAANADPTEFTDGTTHNVLEIYKIVFSSAASGSADFDLTDLVYLTDPVHIVGGANEPAFSSDYITASYSPLSFTTEVIKGKVNIIGACKKNTSTTGITVVCTLPAKYRPVADTYMVANDWDGTTTIVPIIVVVKTTGDVQVGSTVTDTHSILFNLTYFI